MTKSRSHRCRYPTISPVTASLITPILHEKLSFQPHRDPALPVVQARRLITIIVVQFHHLDQIFRASPDGHWKHVASPLAVYYDIAKKKLVLSEVDHRKVESWPFQYPNTASWHSSNLPRDTRHLVETDFPSIIHRPLAPHHTSLPDCHQIVEKQFSGEVSRALGQPPGPPRKSEPTVSRSLPLRATKPLYHAAHYGRRFAARCD